MKADDLFAYQLQACWPVAREALLVLRRVAAVAQGRNIVGQRIHPNVYNVLFVARHWDSPVEAGPADGQIFQPAAHKGEHFPAACFRPDEPGILFVELEQFPLKSGKFEKVVLFAHRLGDAPTVRAGRPWRRVHVKLVRDAVLAGVAPFINKPAFLNYRPELLYTFAVAVLCGPYVIVVGKPHALPEGAELAGDGGREFLRCLSRLPG